MALAALLAASILIAPVGGPIDATGSHLAYSRPEGDRYRLVIDGRDAPVASRREPFDVDLGTDARGRLAAVFTRDGDVRWLDVAAGRERRVPAASRSERVEGAASVSRGRVAFVVPGGRVDRVLRAELTGRRAGPLGAPSVPGGLHLRIEGTELAGDVIAFTSSASRSDSDGGRTELWFARGTERPRPLLGAVNSVNQTNFLFAPQVSSRWVTAGLIHFAGPGLDFSRVVRVSPASGRKQRATVPDAPPADFQAGEPQRELQGLGIGARGAYTSACADRDDNEFDAPPNCRLVRTDLRWR